RSDVDPWTNCEEITAHNFGRAQTIYEAAVYNPFMFGKHIISNLKNVGRTLFVLLSLPGSHFRNIKILLICTIVGIYLYITRKRWTNKKIIKENIRNYKIVFIYLIIYSIPGWIAAIIIFPRAHYLIMPALLFIIAISTLFTSGSRIPMSTIYHKLLVIGCVMVILIPTAKLIQNILPIHQPYKENLTTINFLKSLRISEQVNLLEEEGWNHIYVGDNYTRIAGHWKNTSFEEFIEEKKINMILLSKNLENDTRF